MKDLLRRLLFRKRQSQFDRALKLYAADEFVAAGRLFRNEALAGHPQSQFLLAGLFERGEGTEQNLVEAARWYRAAANHGIVEAQARLGELLLVGVFPSAQAAAAAANAPSGGARGYRTAIDQLMVNAASIRQDPEEAFLWNQRAAHGGNAAAEGRLGYQYAVGLGIAQDLVKAKQHFEAAAIRGDASGQLGLGLLYAKCYGGEADYEQAASWLTLAAEQGNATAKYCLAALSLSEHIAPLDPGRLVELLTDAAEGKHPGAMFQLGELYRLGHGTPVSSSQAETWLRRASANGHVGSALSLAKLLLSITPPDLDSAAAFCRQAAEAGDGQAQLLLGQFYQEGRGVPKDAREAARWLERAADQGVLTAYERLGRLYADDFELEQDFRAAADWFHRAAAEGSVDALYHLGTLQFEGLGVVRDPVAAFKRFSEAAAKGSANAALSLGIMHATGNGVPRDYDRAAEAYRRAIELGSREAKFNIAFLYLRGLGVEKNVERGLELLSESAGDSNVNAAWALHTLFADGTLVQQDDARAAHWLVRAAELGSAQAAERLCDWLDTHEHTGLAASEVVEMISKFAERGEPHAQLSLARLYREGKHIPSDRGLAWKWLQRAAEAGLPSAQVQIGDAYRSGDGVATDPLAAATWYDRAAASGHAGALIGLTRVALELDAEGIDYSKLYKRWLSGAKRGDALSQRMVGEYLLKGIGVERSVEASVYWLEKAADQGNSAAMVMLGGILARGEGDKRSPSQALSFFTRAADAGNADAHYNLGICALEGIGMQPTSEGANQHFKRAAELGSEDARTILAAAAAAAEARAKGSDSGRLTAAASEPNNGLSISKDSPAGQLRYSDDADADARKIYVPPSQDQSTGYPEPRDRVAHESASDFSAAKLAEEAYQRTGQVSDIRELLINGLPETALKVASALGADNCHNMEISILKAIALERLSRFDEAIDLLRKCQTTHPNEPELQAQLGNTLYGAGRLDLALIELESATEARIENVWAHINLSKILETRGMLDSAISGIRRALIDHPTDVHLRIRYGTLLLRKNNEYAGVRVLEEVERDHPAGLEVGEALIEHCLSKGDAMEAIRLSLKQIEKAGASIGLLIRHFLLLLQFDLPDVAEDFYLKNFDQIGHNADIAMQLSEAFDGAGNEAKKEYWKNRNETS